MRSCFMPQALEPCLGLLREALGQFISCVQLCPTPGFDILIPSSVSHKSIISALLLYVTGFEKGLQPRAVRRSPPGRLPPPGVQLSPEPGPHVPASTAAVAAGQVSGCAADSGCLPGLQQWGGCLQMGPPPHPACALAHWRS